MLGKMSTFEFESVFDTLDVGIVVLDESWLHYCLE